MNTDPLVQYVSGAIKRRRESPRYIGRRSIDKSRGEVLFIPEGQDEGKVIETIDLPNFDGERAAKDRAEELSDQWAALHIVETIRTL